MITELVVDEVKAVATRAMPYEYGKETTNEQVLNDLKTELDMALQGYLNIEGLPLPIGITHLHNAYEATDKDEPKILEVLFFRKKIDLKPNRPISLVFNHYPETKRLVIFSTYHTLKKHRNGASRAIQTDILTIETMSKVQGSIAWYNRMVDGTLPERYIGIEREVLTSTLDFNYS